MKITVTARHLDLTKSLHDYTEKKIKKVQRYFENVIDAHIILTLMKYTHIAEAIIHAPGLTINAKQEAGDMYAAVDLLLDNIERQIKRYKEKLKAKSRFHRARRKDMKIGKESAKGVIISQKKTKTSSTQERFSITEIKKFDIKPMTVDEALSQMKVLKHDYWAFFNRDTGKINFIYKKENGDYGIIESEY